MFASPLSPWVLAPLAFIGLALQIYLYGVHCVLFGLLVWMRASRRALHIVLMAGATIGMMLSTTSLALRLKHFFSQFRMQSSTMLTFTRHNLDPVSIANAYIYLACYTIVDSVLIWRLWIVWDKNIYICLPSLIFLVVNTVAGSMDLYCVTSHCGSKMGEGILRWAEASFAAGVAMNCLATGLISFKIWNKKETLQRVFGKSRNSRHYTVVISMLIQSGVLYTIASVGMYILYIVRIDSSVVVDGFFFEIIGISPILMIIYTSLSISEHTAPDNEEHPLQVFAVTTSEDRAPSTLDHSRQSTHNSSKHALDWDLSRARTISAFVHPGTTVDTPPRHISNAAKAQLL